MPYTEMLFIIFFLTKTTKIISEVSWSRKHSHSLMLRLPLQLPYSSFLQLEKEGHFRPDNPNVKTVYNTSNTNWSTIPNWMGMQGRKVKNDVKEEREQIQVGESPP